MVLAWTAMEPDTELKLGLENFRAQPCEQDQTNPYTGEYGSIRRGDFFRTCSSGEDVDSALFLRRKHT